MTARGMTVWESIVDVMRMRVVLSRVQQGRGVQDYRLRMVQKLYNSTVDGCVDAWDANECD